MQTMLRWLRSHTAVEDLEIFVSSINDSEDESGDSFFLLLSSPRHRITLAGNNEEFT